RLRFFLPFHPLRGGPSARMGELLPVVADGWDERQPARPVVGGRREQHSLNEAKYRRGGADPQCQRQYGNKAERRLLEQHPHAQTQLLNHRSSGRFLSWTVAVRRG